MEKILDLETYIVRKANVLVVSSKIASEITKYIAKYAHWVFVVYGIFLFIFPGKNQKERQKTCISIFLSMCICSLISFIIGKKFYRDRPFVKDKNIKDITNHKANAAFPSNHTMNGMVILLQLIKDKAPFSRCFIPVWALMSLSRVFAGIHYVSDLIGGVVIAKIVHRAVNRLF